MIIMLHGRHDTIESMAPPRKPRVPCPTGCGRTACEGSLCNTCYQREWARKKNGVNPNTVSIGRRMAHAPQLDRLLAQVDTSGGPAACHPWGGATNEAGYGIMRWNGKMRRVHVIVWELAHGRSMQPGMLGCHHCDNPPCANWRHVYEGTPKRNYQDQVERGRNSPPPRFVGTAHHAAKLTEAQVYEIRAERDRGAPLGILAERFGVSKPVISKIGRRENWAHLPELTTRQDVRHG